MKLIFSYLRDNLKIIIFLIILLIIYLIVFFLYYLPLEPILYGMILFLVVCIICGTFDFFYYRKKHLELIMMKKNCIYSIFDLQESKCLIEKDYEDIIKVLFDKTVKVTEKGEMDKKDIIDYYTLWVHQIKTPIAAMNILLQREDSEKNLYLTNELFKIEQYVDMALSYIRMGDMSSDLVLKSFHLDDIVRKAVRKYAKLFIGKGIKLEFNELNTTVITDEKWLTFVIEQILSNAIKYTQEGGTISVYIDKEKEKTLIIEDNGIGIKMEDLPRVFEKGFTGVNGRSDKKSTGLGLYLCSNILEKLSHKILIESEVSKYTKVKIDLKTLNLTTM